MRIGVKEEDGIYFGEDMLDGPLFEAANRIRVLKSTGALVKFSEKTYSTAGIALDKDGVIEVWVSRR